MNTIEGDTWHATLTDEEYAAWDIYADAHPLLLGEMGTEAVLQMFLGHFRRGINLNTPVKRSTELEAA